MLTPSPNTTSRRTANGRTTPPTADPDQWESIHRFEYTHTASTVGVERCCGGQVGGPRVGVGELGDLRGDALVQCGGLLASRCALVCRGLRAHNFQPPLIRWRPLLGGRQFFCPAGKGESRR